MNPTLTSFEKLLQIMDELREKCPWDKEQTFESLRNHTIEEAYELAQSILESDYDEIKKEAGDLLLHIVFYAKIGSEKQLFDMKDIIDSLCKKLIYRHPHVFGEALAENEKEVMEQWEALKLKENPKRKTVLSGVPDSLPAMIKANRIQQKARSVGFDWENKEDVWSKVQEELNELKAEIIAQDKERIENEFGDFLFSIINAGRLYGIDPETALEKTNIKFKQRFEYLESKTISQGKSLKDMSLAEMDVYWNEAKKLENKKV